MENIIAKEPTRGDILLAAHKVINGERQNQYGSPEDNFQVIADYVTVYLKDKLAPGEKISRVDIALIMVLLKLARIQSGTGTTDSFVDLAGYAGLAHSMLEADGE